MQKELQKHFIQFHNKIRTDFEDNEILRNKRDLLIRELKAYFKKRSEDTDSPQITFDCFLTKVLNGRGQLIKRLIVKLSVPPGNDLFEKLSDTGMANFEKCLVALV